MINMLEWCKEIENICQELGWKSRVENMDDYLMIICPLVSNDNFSGVLFVISDNNQRLMMSVSYRIKTTSGSRTEMCEAIARISFRLLAGCLELDPDQGEVCYRDGLFLFNTEPNPNLLRAFVATTLRDALFYYPDIETIASGCPLD
jgi:hypothetical protein